ncbi:MAG: hypothetical protein JNL68_07755 [Burkholderiales bacterium]|nr:hypothetical protein [Burkholderiales bacterium]
MNPFAPRDPLPALEALRELVRRSDHDDVRLRLWLDRGLADFLAGRVDSLDAALGLPTPAARRRAECEQMRLVALRLVLLAGWPPEVSLTRRVGRLSALLRGAPRLPGEKDVRAALANMPFRIPTSPRRLWDLVPAALSTNLEILK